jgi:hypothetical protein
MPPQKIDPKAVADMIIDCGERARGRKPEPKK